MDSIGKSKKVVEDILTSVPFEKNSVAKTLFLDIYSLKSSEIQALNDLDEPFVVDNKRLLKLGISLGNLVKSWNTDEEKYVEETRRNLKQPVDRICSGVLVKEKTNMSVSNSFISADSKTQHRDDMLKVPQYRIKFLKGLLNIFKSFNIGNNDFPTKRITSETFRVPSNQGSANNSPIKLTSRQLLIEKLEINMDLDTIFVFKMVFKVLIYIYDIMDNIAKESTKFNNNDDNTISLESMSIYSNSSANSLELDSLLKQSLSRISNGLINPFLNKIVLNIVNPAINHSTELLLKQLSN